MTNEEALSKCYCLLLLCAAPPIMFTFDLISGQAHKEFSCRRPLPRGISLYLSTFYPWE